MESLDERVRRAEEAMAPPARPLTTEADLELARALKAKGHSDRQIGRYFNTSAMTVRRRLDPAKYEEMRTRWAVNLKKARAKKRQLDRREIRRARRDEAQRLVRASPLGTLTDLLLRAGRGGTPDVIPPDIDAVVAQITQGLEARAAAGDPRATAALERIRSQS